MWRVLFAYGLLVLSKFTHLHSTCFEDHKMGVISATTVCSYCWHLRYCSRQGLGVFLPILICSSGSEDWGESGIASSASWKLPKFMHYPGVPSSFSSAWAFPLRSFDPGFRGRFQLQNSVIGFFTVSFKLEVYLLPNGCQRRQGLV